MAQDLLPTWHPDGRLEAVGTRSIDVRGRRVRPPRCRRTPGTWRTPLDARGLTDPRSHGHVPQVELAAMLDGWAGGH